MVFALALAADVFSMAFFIEFAVFGVPGDADF
jgi:hypothetical protein